MMLRRYDVIALLCGAYTVRLCDCVAMRWYARLFVLCVW